MKLCGIAHGALGLKNNHTNNHAIPWFNQKNEDGSSLCLFLSGSFSTAATFSASVLNHPITEVHQHPGINHYQTDTFCLTAWLAGGQPHTRLCHSSSELNRFFFFLQELLLLLHNLLILQCELWIGTFTVLQQGQQELLHACLEDFGVKLWRPTVDMSHPEISKGLKIAMFWWKPWYVRSFQPRAC